MTAIDAKTAGKPGGQSTMDLNQGQAQPVLVGSASVAYVRYEPYLTLAAPQ